MVLVKYWCFFMLCFMVIFIELSEGFFFGLLNNRRLIYQWKKPTKTTRFYKRKPAVTISRNDRFITQTHKTSTNSWTPIVNETPANPRVTYTNIRKISQNSSKVPKTSAPIITKTVIDDSALYSDTKFLNLPTVSHKYPFRGSNYNFPVPKVPQVSSESIPSPTNTKNNNSTRINIKDLLSGLSFGEPDQEPIKETTEQKVKDSIIEVIGKTDNLQTLFKIAQDVKLGDTLQSFPQVTLFAPSDKAFAQLSTLGENGSVESDGNIFRKKIKCQISCRIFVKFKLIFEN